MLRFWECSLPSMMYQWRNYQGSLLLSWWSILKLVSLSFLSAVKLPSYSSSQNIIIWKQEYRYLQRLLMHGLDRYFHLPSALQNHVELLNLKDWQAEMSHLDWSWFMARHSLKCAQELPRYHTYTLTKIMDATNTLYKTYFRQKWNKNDAICRELSALKFKARRDS